MDTQQVVEDGTMEYAIEVDNLKIRYKCLNKISLRKSLLSWKKSEVDIFEAVKGVSFKVPKGEIMGIVGKNGSGKSTMLRAIAGIFLRMRGRLTSMAIQFPCCLLELVSKSA